MTRIYYPKFREMEIIKMNKTELVEAIASSTELTKTDVDKVVTALVEVVTDALGIEDCGCQRRREILNELFPYTTPNENKIVSQNINDFCEGIYIFNNNLVFTRDGESFNYKIGDKILIKLDNPFYNDFRQYYSLGLISKE